MSCWKSLDSFYETEPAGLGVKEPAECETFYNLNKLRRR